MNYEIHAIETNLATLRTTVRFRVWEEVGTVQRVKDECRVTLEGRYDLNSEGLEDAVSSVYETEVLNA